MDTGLISLKPSEYERGVDNYRKNALLPGQSKIEVAPLFEIGDPVVVEWRALTIAYLDLIADQVRESLRLSRQLLSLSQLMEGGTWSAGRELAEISRPNTHQPPIIIKVSRSQDDGPWQLTQFGIFRWRAMYFVDTWAYFTLSTIIQSALCLLLLIDNDYHPFLFFYTSLNNKRFRL